MTRWTKQQDNVLWEHGHEGAERCAAIIRRRFGVSRSPEAVRQHAYRIGASIVRYEICPSCGRKTTEISRRGVCPICHKQELIRERRAFNETLRDEIRSIRQTDEYKQAEREYATARKESSNLCKKYGLRNKDERRKEQSGDFVDMSS